MIPTRLTPDDLSQVYGFQYNEAIFLLPFVNAVYKHFYRIRKMETATDLVDLLCNAYILDNRPIRL